ncbi:MAG: right-handed parallel beta-helix repeat-containing protein [Dokdonella sp.]|uniref:right-handed parallel beta-helix repeat-containing protein n=1 Tax=Dokdonella sp. TaxID=2291710 RepID=UPI003263BBC5
MKRNRAPSRSRRSVAGYAIAVVLVGCCTHANATDIEIGPGEDFRTAMQSLLAGDTLTLRGGIYPLTDYFDLELTGTASQPITIRAKTGEQPHLQFIGSSQNIVNISDSAFLVIDGIEFSGGSRGLRLTRSSDITVRNCHVHHTAANAIAANDVGSDYARLTFVHNEVDHAGGTAEGLYLGCNDDECRVHDSLIADNYIHDLTGAGVTQGDGIEIKLGSYGNVVRDNVIHHTAYPAITLYGVNGRGARNIIERNVIWTSGDNGIQVDSDAIVRNNIVLGAAGAGFAANAQQGVRPGNLDIVNNTIINAGGDAIHLSNVGGAILLANNALYASAHNAVFANGTASLVTLTHNIGSGALSGVSSGFDSSGAIGDDFVDASSGGTPPQNLIPKARLLGSADGTLLPNDDFDGLSRAGATDVGAYRARSNDQPGWALQAGFKQLTQIFASGFEHVD